MSQVWAHLPLGGAKWLSCGKKKQFYILNLHSDNTCIIMNGLCLCLSLFVFHHLCICPSVSCRHLSPFLSLFFCHNLSPFPDFCGILCPGLFLFFARCPSPSLFLWQCLYPGQTPSSGWHLCPCPYSSSLRPPSALCLPPAFLPPRPPRGVSHSPLLSARWSSHRAAGCTCRKRRPPSPLWPWWHEVEEVRRRKRSNLLGFPFLFPSLPSSSPSSLSSFSSSLSCLRQRQFLLLKCSVQK